MNAIKLSALVLALAALLVGCGGGEEGPASTTSPPASTTRSQQAQTETTKRGANPPVVSGGTSIESFGAEAEGSERAAILASFKGYLGALGEEDPATACSYLAAAVKQSLKQFVAPRLKAKGCAAILPSLLAPTAPAIAREQANGRIVKVRAQGDRAFVVFAAPGAKLYQQTMGREGDQWKVTTVAASVLVPDLGY